MQIRVNLQPAYVLHSRPYRETSAIVDVLTPEYGRISLVARGARQPKSGFRAAMQPFVQLLVSWQGRGSLKTLVQVEAMPAQFRLQAKQLLSGMYLNELLIRLLKSEDHCEDIFAVYSRTLLQLAHSAELEPALRRFELSVLHHLGYALPFPRANEDGRLDQLYFYDPQGYFVPPSREVSEADRQRCFEFDDLIAIADDDFSSQKTRKAAKRLLRLALAPLLGDRPLRSRELFS